MFEIDQKLKANNFKAILVCLELYSEQQLLAAGAASSPLDWQEEARLLAKSAGYEVVEIITGKREKPDAALFAGRGKVESINEALAQHEASTVIFNHRLSPVQTRNLEGELKVPVVDRTELILDIFADRAKSHEGKLQVELARLQHQATRLVRGWTHLERQRGGIGGRGGPGEKQIELDRRMIGERVKRLKQQLAKIETQRNTQRRSRQKGQTLRVAIVGYTNAGKSTLFNRITREKTLAQDKLFATLDTTTRRVYIAGPADEHGMTQGLNITLTDTVGFIRDLPHTLVDAFKATLEETIEADYLLHVVDASNPAQQEQMSDVRAVLAEIGAGDLPEIVTYNKIDRRSGVEPGVFDLTGAPIGAPPTLHVSALSGAGIDDLRLYLHSLATGCASVEQNRRDEVAREVHSSDYFKPGRAVNSNQNIENGTIHPDLISVENQPEVSARNLR